MAQAKSKMSKKRKLALERKYEKKKKKKKKKKKNKMNSWLPWLRASSELLDTLSRSHGAKLLQFNRASN